MKFGLKLILLSLLTKGAMAQPQSDHFLAEVFAINSFNMNSTLQEVQNDKQIAENLSVRDKMDNTVSCRLTGQPINLPGLRSLDRLAFDTLELSFENNKLHDVFLDIPSSFKDRIFTKTFDQFNAKYGQAVIVDQKKSNSKRYVWNVGANELTLNPYPDGLVIHYASKIVNKRTGWIYGNRKGKGSGTIQLNLGYLEKMLDEKLAIASFEKILPQWETTGGLNHVFYMYNFRTLAENIPSLSITYSFNKCNIRVTADDTTSKVITEFALEKIKDGNFWTQLEKDLDNSHYIKRPRMKYSPSVIYSNHKYLVFLDKEDSRISIMNDFKLKLP
jgi:hypothetical protein